MKPRLFLVALLVSAICLSIQYFWPFLPTLIEVGWIVKGILCYGVVVLTEWILRKVSPIQEPIQETFLSTLLVWVLGLFVPVAICLTPLIWLHLFIRRGLTARSFSASLLGAGTVVLLTTVWQYLIH